MLNPHKSLSNSSSSIVLLIDSLWIIYQIVLFSDFFLYLLTEYKWICRDYLIPIMLWLFGEANKATSNIIISGHKDDLFAYGVWNLETQNYTSPPQFESSCACHEKRS